MAQPTPTYPADSVVLALDGTTNPDTGLEYIPKGTGPGSAISYEIRYNRDRQRFNQQLKRLNELSAWIDGALTIGVFAGEYRLGGVLKTYAGSSANAIADASTKKVYLDSSNLLQVAAAYPGDETTFYPIATVTAAGGAITTVVDDRPLFVVFQNVTGSEIGTDSPTFILDADNAAGAGVDTQLQFERGTGNSENAALEWKTGGTDRFNLLSQHSTGTLASLNALSLLISGTLALDVNGAAKVAAAVAGNGLDHAAGVLSVKTASANGTSIDGAGIVTVDPSDGIAIDANGVAVSLTANGGLEVVGAAGSRTLGAKVDDATIESVAGGLQVRDAGLAPAKLAVNAQVPGSGVVEFTVDIVAGVSVTLHNADAPFKYRIIRAWSVAQSTDAGTWKLEDGTSDITDVVAVTATIDFIDEPTTLITAKTEIAKNGTLRVIADGTLADAQVHILAIPIA